MEFISVASQEPVPVSHVLTYLIKNPTSNESVREVYGVFPQSFDTCLLAREILYDVPGLIRAAGIKDVDGIGPIEHMLKALADDVSLVTNWQHRVETHCSHPS